MSASKQPARIRAGDPAPKGCLKVILDAGGYEEWRKEAESLGAKVGSTCEGVRFHRDAAPPAKSSASA